MLSIQELHARAGSPDLSHWNAAETFSLLEAALLSIGADPLEWQDMDWVRNNNHANWKYGALLLRGLREGICTGAIVFIDAYQKIPYNDGNDWYPQKVEVFDLSIGQADDVMEGRTIISRKALFDWYKKKGLIGVSRVPATIETNKNHETAQARNEVDITPIALAVPSYLNPANPLSPVELRASVEAWEVVTSEGKYKEGKAIKDAVRTVLDTHPIYKKMSNEAKLRICTVANWDKKGGAPKTPV